MDDYDLNTPIAYRRENARAPPLLRRAANATERPPGGRQASYTPVPADFARLAQAKQMPLPIEFQIPSDPTLPPLKMRAGELTIIAGPNGVGKSALLYQLYKMAGHGEATYYPGHRQITFNNGWDNLQQDPQQISQNLYAAYDAFGRYKNMWSEDMFKYVIRSLQNIENQHNRHIVETIKSDANAAAKAAKERTGPIEQINRAFETAGLAVSLTIDRVGLLVHREGQTYRIDQMSDGERAALLLAGAIITQEPNTVIMVDEPERHLHPSISSPLVRATIRMRQDISYILATHDISLIESLPQADIIHVTNSEILEPKPESRSYTATVIGKNSPIPNDLKLDIIGSRKNILFSEGTISSIDYEVYSRIFADKKVVPRGGWEKCVEAVKALSNNPTLHWIKASAIIDSDGKTPPELASLLTDGVHALPCPTIENLLLTETVIQAVAATLHSASGPPPEDRLRSVRDQLHTILAEQVNEMAARQTSWRVNQTLSSMKVSVQDVRKGKTYTDAINIKDIFDISVAEIEEAIKKSDPISAIWKLPLKNSPIPNKISEILGANTFRNYVEIVVRQMDIDSVYGIYIRDNISSHLPKL